MSDAEEKTDKRMFPKVLLYLLGCIIFAVGATFFIKSSMGTDPLDVLSLGVKKALGWKIGTTQSLFAALMILIYWFLEKVKFPPLTPFLTFFMCGYMIDFFIYLTAKMSGNSYLQLLLGVVLCTTGSAFIIMSSFGIRAMDLVAISLMKKTNKPFWLYKGMFEVLLMASGYLLGGPVGLGTVLFLLGVGWLIQPTIRAYARLGVRNFSAVR